MFNPWYPVMLLAFESSEVVTLRILKMGRGGADAWDETHTRAAARRSVSCSALLREMPRQVTVMTGCLRSKGWPAVRWASWTALMA